MNGHEGMAPMAVRSDLPPVPDDHGEPRPPRAPRVNGPWPIRDADGHCAMGHHSDGKLIRMNGSPYEVLEQVVIRRVNRWSSAWLPVLGLWGGPALLFSIYAVMVGPPATVFAILALILALVVPVTYLRVATGWRSYLVVAAGPRYVGCGTWMDTDRDGRVVGLRGLTRITLRQTRSQGLVLRLGHPGDRPLDLPLGAVEANQQLWDLVYNALLHRAAAGAQVDRWTRERLDLPSPDA